MGLMERDINVSRRTVKAKNETTVTDGAIRADAIPQDEHLWECAIANSIDAIREMAKEALADRQAGRTKRITL